jgi:hypothetical protein
MGAVYYKGKLACDRCGRVGGTKRQKCPHNYCPSVALCPGCKGENPHINSEENHAVCKMLHAKMVATHQKEEELRNAGKCVRQSAMMKEGKGVQVIFVGNKQCLGFYMAAETYRAIPLENPATPEDYEKFGKLEPAPINFFGEES